MNVNKVAIFMFSVKNRIIETQIFLNIFCLFACLQSEHRNPSHPSVVLKPLPTLYPWNHSIVSSWTYNSKRAQLHNKNVPTLVRLSTFSMSLSASPRSTLCLSQATSTSSSSMGWQLTGTLLETHRSSPFPSQHINLSFCWSFWFTAIYRIRFNFYCRLSQWDFVST